MGLTFSRLISRETIVYKAKDADLSLAEKLAEQYEPKVAKAVQVLLQTAADAIDMDALIAALHTGDAGKVLAVIDAAAGVAQASGSGALKYALQDALWAAGAQGAIKLAASGQAPPFVRGEFHFDRINPALNRWLEEYHFSLIKQVNSTTREAIRDVLVENMLGGKGPAAQATQIKDVIGLTTRQGKAVSNFRKQLETFHTKRSAASWKLGEKPDRVNGHNVWKPDTDGKPKDGMLQRRLRDLRYDGVLEKAMKTGKALTPAQIDKMVEAYARKFRRHRAGVIARTESLRTTNAGIQEAYRQAIEAGTLDEALVRRLWLVAKDERLCKECAPVPGMNEKGVRFAQPFATPSGPVFLPPLHPNCRCTVFVKILEPAQAGLVNP